MKEHIAKYLVISENDFIMKRFSHNGQELKNLNEKLDIFNSNNLSVYVEYGKPLDESKTIMYIY